MDVAVDGYKIKMVNISINNNSSNENENENSSSVQSPEQNSSLYGKHPTSTTPNLCKPSIKMKFYTLLLLLTSSTTLTVTASPMPHTYPDIDIPPSDVPLPAGTSFLDPSLLSADDSDSTLSKRGTTCKIKRRFRWDLVGQCINTNKADCTGGRLYPGHCPGGNNIICCIQ